MSVALRRARADDLDFLLELVTDEETRPYLSAKTVSSRAGVAAEIERSERDPDEFGWFVVEVDGERGGCVAFHCVNEEHGIVEVSRFALAPRFRGRHLADRAARLFQRHVLLELGFHRLELQVYGFNERAIAHAERSGYVREGVKRRAYLRHGEWQDAVLFGLLREELDSTP
jgi:RimJ/RimL family protein N-acetyltransferase